MPHLDHPAFDASHVRQLLHEIDGHFVPRLSADLHIDDAATDLVVVLTPYRPGSEETGAARRFQVDVTPTEPAATSEPAPAPAAGDNSAIADILDALRDVPLHYHEGLEAMVDVDIEDDTVIVTLTPGCAHLSDFVPDPHQSVRFAVTLTPYTPPTIPQVLQAALADAEHHAVTSVLARLLDIDVGAGLRWRVSPQAPPEARWQHVVAVPERGGEAGLRDFAVAAATINAGAYTFAASADTATPKAAWSFATHQGTTVEIQLNPVPLPRDQARALIDAVIAETIGSRPTTDASTSPATGPTTDRTGTDRRPPW
jgi:hypothetical protein